MDRMTKLIAGASAELGEMILASEAELMRDAMTLDKLVLELVRRIGKGAVAHVLNALATRLVNDRKTEGFSIHRQGRCSVRTVLGVVEVTSPYLRHPVTAETARPVREGMGLSGAMKTPAVERALADFGAEVLRWSREAIRRALRPRGRPNEHPARRRRYRRRG